MPFLPPSTINGGRVLAVTMTIWKVAFSTTIWAVYPRKNAMRWIHIVTLPRRRAVFSYLLHSLVELATGSMVSMCKVISSQFFESNEGPLAIELCRPFIPSLFVLLLCHLQICVPGLLFNRVNASYLSFVKLMPR